MGRWVIVAPERAERPSAFLRPAPQEDHGICPFCPGNEAMTPPEILSRRENGTWTLRVVPNRYPALRTEIQMSRAGEGMLDSMAGVGAHEVVIETNVHRATLAELPAEQIESVLGAWQERMVDLSLALPFVPEVLRAEERAAAEHFAAKERCIFCDVIAQEQREKERVVLESDDAVVLSPWAARSPFELWILPRDHHSSFETAPQEQLRAVAEALRTVLRKVEVALEKPAFNLFLQTMPLREPQNDYYHWRLSLKPVLTLQAGFEWASGCSINPTPPEEAASFLRQTEVIP